MLGSWRGSAREAYGQPLAMNYTSTFTSLTSHPEPHPWQQALASETVCRSRIVRVPTGLGKTEGVITTWTWHSLVREGGDHAWPRRLVWCLPMRVLVEQTIAVADAIASQLPEDVRPLVLPIMGGEDAGEWFLYPERPAILVGTQDMLLSRALNRGYGSGRARWPAEYGLLHHDALWIMDEVQLMDVGLATSAQLQAYRDQDCRKGLRPCHTWWMSATLQETWLKTIDTEDRHDKWVHNPVTIPSEQRNGGVWQVTKSLQVDEIGTADHDAFAKRILDEHAKIDANARGRVTLVVCNTVERACKTHEALRQAGHTDGIELIHSRFRPHERKQWRDNFLNRKACEDKDADRIIVATQVVEAGVDISAGCLVTELAPWPSLVQRFGRCARYGGTGRVLVVDRGRDETTALPYAPDELTSAWTALQKLSDVGISALENYEESLTPDDRQQLYPYDPPHLLLRREFDELFDTTPDLTGADLDISRFIRSGDERDLLVFWRSIVKGKSPVQADQPRRDELCPVPFLIARDWLCERGTKSDPKPKLRSGMRAWVWDWLDGKWKEAERVALLPGRIVCVAAECGGYTQEGGFSPNSKQPVEPVLGDVSGASPPQVQIADAHHDGEDLSVSQWKTIACHSREVAAAVRNIASAVGLPPQLIELLILAARWHDVGKAHPAFQGTIRRDDRPPRQDLAKAPDAAWLKPPGTYRPADDSDSRPTFRHELASASALFSVLERHRPGHPALLGPWTEVLLAMGHHPAITPDAQAGDPTALEQAVLDLDAERFDLLVYLVAAHHGKVRVALHASPKDQDYLDHDGRGLPIRGVREGDTIPPIRLDGNNSSLPELALTLEPAKLGLSPRTGASWRERTIGLLNRHGPVALAYLEALLRAADVRASCLNTLDPAFEAEVVK